MSIYLSNDRPYLSDFISSPARVCPGPVLIYLNMVRYDDTEEIHDRRPSRGPAAPLGLPAREEGLPCSDGGTHGADRHAPHPRHPARREARARNQERGHGRCKYPSTTVFARVALEGTAGPISLNHMSASRFTDVDLRTCCNCK